MRITITVFMNNRFISPSFIREIEGVSVYCIKDLPVDDPIRRSKGDRLFEIEVDAKDPEKFKRAIEPYVQIRRWVATPTKRQKFLASFQSLERDIVSRVERVVRSQYGQQKVSLFREIGKQTVVAIEITSPKNATKTDVVSVMTEDDQLRSILRRV